MAGLYATRWDLVLLSILFFVALLAFTPFRRRVDWKVHGIYTAFIVALFTEMFGIPLTIYFISSYFNRITFESDFFTYVNTSGMPVGFVITGVGLILIISVEENL